MKVLILSIFRIPAIQYKFTAPVLEIAQQANRSRKTNHLPPHSPSQGAVGFVLLEPRQIEVVIN
jgi:hypothetical protein